MLPAEFPGSPMVKTSPSNDSTPGWGAKIPQTLRPKSKTQNRSNIVTNSIKTLNNWSTLKKS